MLAVSDLMYVFACTRRMSQPPTRAALRPPRRRIETGNVQRAAVVFDSVVKLADASPFKALSDVASARKALGEEGKQWEF